MWGFACPWVQCFIYFTFPCDMAHLIDGNFDTRDISRIRNNIRLVEKFASHNRKHPENAVQHMVSLL